MSLLVRINELVNLNSQFIISTHSPILLTFPQAQIFEIKKNGIFEKKYFETEHYKLMKNFFENPNQILKSLLKK